MNLNPEKANGIKHGLSFFAKLLGYPSNLDRIYYTSKRRTVGHLFLPYHGDDHLELPSFMSVIIPVSNNSASSGDRAEDRWTKWNFMRMLFPTIYAAMDTKTHSIYRVVAAIADIAGIAAPVMAAMISDPATAVGIRAAYQVSAAVVSTINNSSMLRSTTSDNSPDVAK